MGIQDKASRPASNSKKTGQPFQPMLDGFMQLAEELETSLSEIPSQIRAERLLKLEEAVENLLDVFEIDWEDENFTETPTRVARAFLDYWAVGYMMHPEDVFTVFDNDAEEDGLVVVKDIPFYSTCAHHLAPFFGKAAIVYMPDKHVVGLSKTARILEVFARRFQLQEHITKQVADAIMEHLNPKGVMVILYNVEHTCMTSRGIQAHGAKTTTSTVRGIFAEDPTLRSDALRLIGV